MRSDSIECAVRGLLSAGLSSPVTISIASGVSAEAISLFLAKQSPLTVEDARRLDLLLSRYALAMRLVNAQSLVARISHEK